MILRKATLSVLIGSAAVLGGAYLYTVHGPRRHRRPVGLATGILVGKQLGAAGGFAVGGPPGVLPGALAGGIAGAALGHDLATPPGAPA